MAILNSQRVTYITQNSFAYEKNKKNSKTQDWAFFCGNQHAEIQTILGFKLFLRWKWLQTSRSTTEGSNLGLPAFWNGTSYKRLCQKEACLVDCKRSSVLKSQLLYLPCVLQPLASNPSESGLTIRTSMTS